MLSGTRIGSSRLLMRPAFHSEYPDFYTKLYSLLDRSVLHVRYRPRFFRLLDIFMSSSHLPANLVASFIKRLSRLALSASPAAIVTVVPFVYNLLKRHPSCMVLVHRSTEGDDYDWSKGTRSSPLECLPCLQAEI